ncbi:uncharacterized protein [Eleutherodactylus coqui]|uniref:uncharacterized protein isoform X3 n=1 Tax=Eleutherodactylus coqui TaxID=57060 RepID=UPI003461B846
MGLTLQEVLVRALKKLEESSLQKFIEKLRVLEVREQYTKIPKDELTGKDPEHIAGLISTYYRDVYGAEVTLDILEDINEKKVREELQQDLMEVDTRRTPMFTAGGHFIDRHRADLIHGITNVDPVLYDLYRKGVLTKRQRDYIRRGNPGEKMRRLYESIGDWHYRKKEEVYNSFYKHNPRVIDDMEMQEDEPQLEEGFGVSFIDRHRSHLIIRITDVDPVLRDLRDQKLLTQEQYDDVVEKPTNQEKMEELCDVISHWEDAGKYKAYITLRRLNKHLITDLEMKDKMWREVKLPDLRAGDHFIDRHRADLIHGITDVDPVVDDLFRKDLLTIKEQDYIMRPGEPEEKMRRLYAIIRVRDYWDKEEVYNSLYKYNPHVIDDLKIQENESQLEEGFGVTFIDRHRSDLVIRITDVDPVLRDLRDQKVLTQKQYDDVMEKPTNQEKMEELCDVISHWEDAGKYKAYITLRRLNKHLITDLEMKDKMWREVKLPDLRAGVHFIDRNRADLIHGITNVDPVIYDLYRKDLLTVEERDNIMRPRHPEEKMRRLYESIRDWDYWDKEEVSNSFYKYNPRVIDDLKIQENEPQLEEAADHFIYRHKEDLIHRIKAVDPVVDDLYRKRLLKKDEHDDIRKLPKPEDKMRRLYVAIRDRHDCDKEVYRTLYKHNQSVLDEILDDLIKSKEKAADHFIYRHKEDLIHRIKVVDPVVDDLYRKRLLKKDEHDDIRRLPKPENKMRRLYVAIRDRHDCDKEVYRTLYKHNQSVLDEILDDLTESKEKAGDHFIYRYKEVLIHRIQTVDPVIDDLYRDEQLTKDERDDIRRLPKPEDKMRRLYVAIRDCPVIRDRDYWDKEVYRTLYKHNQCVLDEILDDLTKSKEKEASQKSDEPQMSAAWMAVDNLNCKLCGKEPDLTEVVSTIASFNKLELKSPGLYRCHKTGIKFLVNSPVIINCMIDSWSDHLKDIADNYQILGTLFNITVYGEPNAVSAVYLPHYLCLKSFTGDTSHIKCAHFTDGNMMLVTPTQIDPFYIALENPTFSCMGPLLSFRRKTPIHGTVLIYFTLLCQGDPDEEHRIHLYVLPYSRSAEENLDKENEKFGYQRIKKPEHTVDPVYSKVKYHVTGHPGVSVHPKTLKFQSEPHQFTEIRLMQKNTDIVLSVAREVSEGPVWEAHLPNSDIRNIIQLLPRRTLHEEKMQDLASATQRLSLREVSCGLSQHHSNHFLDIHLGDLTRLITMVAPVLDDLLPQKLISHEQYHNVHKEKSTEKQMRALYDCTSCLRDVDKDKVIKALRRHNPSSRIWELDSL